VLLEPEVAVARTLDGAMDAVEEMYVFTLAEGAAAGSLVEGAIVRLEGSGGN
jgi:hypothetical protein